MNIWKIEYWSEGENKSPVEKWLLKLAKEKFNAVSKELAILEILGNELSMPRSRALGRGLFELRESKYGCRVY